MEATDGAQAEEQALPADAPRELVAALAARRATVVELERGRFQHPGRTYFACSSPEGRLHGHYSTTPGDVALFAYEVEIRRLVGADGVLRAPPVLADGPGWMLAATVDPEPLAAPDAIARIVEAGMRIPELDLPASPWPSRPGGRLGVLARRLRLLRAPLPTSDVVAARRLLESTPLPAVTSHGSYQRLHVFLADGAAWVIDWEQVGKRPLGYDLMTYWANLDDDDLRPPLFAAAVEALGRRHERDLLRLRYALLVRMIASKFADDDDAAGGTRLLDLLPAAREEALL